MIVDFPSCTPPSRSGISQPLGSHWQLMICGSTYRWHHPFMGWSRCSHHSDICFLDGFYIIPSCKDLNKYPSQMVEVFLKQHFFLSSIPHPKPQKNPHVVRRNPLQRDVLPSILMVETPTPHHRVGNHWRLPSVRRHQTSWPRTPASYLRVFRWFIRIGV